MLTSSTLTVGSMASKPSPPRSRPFPVSVIEDAVFDALDRRSLRDKLILAFLLPTLLLVALNGAMTYWVARGGLEEELGARLIAIGQTLAAELSGGVEAGQLARMDESKVRTRDRLRHRLEAIRAQTGARRLFLFDPELKSLVDTRGDVSFGQKLFTLEADRFELERVLKNGESTTSVLFSDEDGTRYKTAYVPILLQPEDEQAEPEVVAALGVEASASFFDLLTDFASGLILLGIFGLVLVILVGVFFARRLVKPVNELVVAAKSLGEGALDEPIISPDMLERSRGGDELASLRVSFEEMRRAILGRDRQMQMMLSGIAHEVRNPLGGMELFCGLLKEDLEWDDPVDEDKIEKVDRIQRELVYLNKVVTDFLDFARHRPLELERFDAATLAEEIQNLLANDASEHGCELVLDLEVQGDEGGEEGEKLELSADRERLRRAIINTVRNAWQASPDGGAITLRVMAPTALERVIEIQDQGAGIPEEKLAEILTPFFTTKEKGSGLGLALTGKIIEQHGGQMTIDSTVGEGTTVRFTLPFDPDVEQAEQAQAAIPEGWLG